MADRQDGGFPGQLFIRLEAGEDLHWPKIIPVLISTQN